LYLGFDYGAKRIGVAIGERLTMRARPLPVVRNGREIDWNAIEKIFEDWRPAGCVVGLPLNEDGSDQRTTHQSRNFAMSLQLRFALPVHLCDERMSSRSADGELREARADGLMNRRVRSGDRDGVAARLILEQWLATPATTDA
jgi:putative Holliday junction resolvase